MEKQRKENEGKKQAYIYKYALLCVENLTYFFLSRLSHSLVPKHSTKSRTRLLILSLERRII